MKNPEEFLTEAAEKLQEGLKLTATRLVIGFRRGQLVVVPVHQVGTLEIKFRVYKREDIERGLTIAQWDVLGKKIVAFLADKEQK